MEKVSLALRRLHTGDRLVALGTLGDVRVTSGPPGVSWRMALKTAPVTTTITEDDTELDPGKHAHIVVTKPGETATAVVLEARIMGTPIEALCGHVFVPQRDPLQLPICPKCKEIYDLMRMMNEHLHETPRS